MALVAASCGSDSDCSSDSAAPADTEAAVETTTADTEPADTEPADTEPADTEPTDTRHRRAARDSLALPAPDGEPIIVGMVNTEGSPRARLPRDLDADAGNCRLPQRARRPGWPTDRDWSSARPAARRRPRRHAPRSWPARVSRWSCSASISFPGYDTFTASNIPVTGVLPILPPDYTANALFLGGGNTTTTAAMAEFAKENFGAKTAGIVSADNAGANGTEADLKAASRRGRHHLRLDQGRRQRDRRRVPGPDEPGHGRRSRRAVLAVRRRRLYRHDAGPSLTRHRDTGDHDRHLQQRRGDQPGRRRRRRLVLRRGARPRRRARRRRADLDAILESLGSTNATELGLGVLGASGLLTLAPSPTPWPMAVRTSPAPRSTRRLGASDGMVNWPDGNPLACGAAPSIPTICNFSFPIATYLSGEGTSRPSRDSRHSTRPRTCRDAVAHGDSMTDYLFFILLGTGAGAIIAAFGLGLVVTYQGSGLVNFGYGAMATWSGYVYAELRQGAYPFPIPGLPDRYHFGEDVGIWWAFGLSLLTAALMGLLVYTSGVPAVVSGAGAGQGRGQHRARDRVHVADRATIRGQRRAAGGCDPPAGAGHDHGRRDRAPRRALAGVHRAADHRSGVDLVAVHAARPRHEGGGREREGRDPARLLPAAAGAVELRAGVAHRGGRGDPGVADDPAVVGRVHLRLPHPGARRGAHRGLHEGLADGAHRSRDRPRAVELHQDADRLQLVPAVRGS